MSLHSVSTPLGALSPSPGVAFLFYVVIKAMLEGDRSERLAHSKWEADQERSASLARQSNNVDERDSALRESSRMVEVLTAGEHRSSARKRSSFGSSHGTTRSGNAC